MNGIVKSTAFSLSEVMVKSVIARSAFWNINIYVQHVSVLNVFMYFI